MARQLGNFIGEFLEYDALSLAKGWHQFLRIRVNLDVRNPIKRKKLISMARNQSVYALFPYEKLPLFCFLCGRLGHGESFCPVRLTLRDQQVAFGWDLSLRAIPRRGGQAMSKWLREAADDDNWSERAVEKEVRARRFGVEISN
ncbi:hypothetical protein J1N35_009718 [Gossypium stocksii]|uniref:Zinc knuckle CX2CX4HX4C domain-containing protein n=1 Tax=Gossypium stocksii TaxID=47602 RepID=A0A9D3W158_9ROSI|nr:hypothetical protein J1N35_009718 [Gossypium stocksii]